MKNTYPNNQSGQALLFVIIAMTIALTIGVAATSRTVTSLRSTSTTDTSSRVGAAAEGGIEYYLIQPVSVLDKLDDGDNQSGTECPTGTTAHPTNPAACVLSFVPQTTEDQITSQASLTVQRFTTNNSINNGYWFNLEPGSIKEVALKQFDTASYYSGNLQVCWQSLDAAQSTLIYYVIYNSNGATQKVLLAPRGTINGSISVAGTTTATGSRPGYSDCYTVNISGNQLGIRFRSLYATSKVEVFPSAGSFPTQGFKITSIGELGNVANQARVTRELVVYKSLNYLPAIFDYIVYSNGAID